VDGRIQGGIFGVEAPKKSEGLGVSVPFESSAFGASTFWVWGTLGLKILGVYWPPRIMGLDPSKLFGVWGLKSFEDLGVLSPAPLGLNQRHLFASGFFRTSPQASLRP
jgi:hypothetical protein